MGDAFHLRTEVRGVEALNAAMKRMQQDMNKAAPDAVRWAARRVAAAGATLSKPGKKKRRLFQEPLGRRGSFGQRKAFYLIRYHQHRAPEKMHLATGYRASEVRLRPGVERMLQIKHHGLARRVWQVIGGRIGRRVHAKGRGAGRTAHRQARVRQDLRPEAPMVEMTNRLSYLEAAYPGITVQAVSLGADHLRRQIDRQVAQATQRANR